MNTRVFRTQASTDVRRETWEGRDWLVAPVVMLREGVRNGELVQASEITAYPESWNGIPVTLNHPRSNGQNIDANQPGVLSAVGVGRIFHTHVPDAISLHAEMWIDIEKANSLDDGKRLVARLEANEAIEVSTGYFTDISEGKGTFGGKSYDGIQWNPRPNHLAVLLDDIGACSWTDGCGVPRLNAQISKENTMTTNSRATRYLLSKSEMSFDQIANLLRMALQSEDEAFWYWLQDVFDGFVVYEKSPKLDTSTAPTELLKRDYSIVDSKVTFGQPVAVQRRTIFEEITTNDSMLTKTRRLLRDLADTLGLRSSTEPDATHQPQKENSPMDKKQLVDALITNKRFGESDRPWLDTLSEEQLKAVPATNVAAPAPGTAAAPTTNANCTCGKTPAVNTAVVADTAPVKPAEPATMEAFLGSAPDSTLKRSLLANLAEENAKRTELITKITANNSGWTAERLATFETAELVNLHRALSPADYSGAPGVRTNVTTNEEIADTPALLLATKKEAVNA